MTVKTMLLLLLTILTFGARSQNFEGQMGFRVRVKSRIPGISDEKLNTICGSSQDYFIKGGKYKSLSNSEMIAMQLYDPSSNRVYNKYPHSDTLRWVDAGKSNDEVTGFEIKKNAETVLGNPCDALILTTKSGTTTYYYSNKYKLDKTKFVAHKFNNWSFVADKTGALPLKTVIENKQLRLEMTVVIIKPMTLPDSMFAIPANVPIKVGM